MVFTEDTPNLTPNFQSTIKYKQKQVPHPTSTNDTFFETLGQYLLIPQYVEMFYLNSTLNFGIPPALVFQLEVYYEVDKLLTAKKMEQLLDVIQIKHLYIRGGVII